MVVPQVAIPNVVICEGEHPKHQLWTECGGASFEPTYNDDLPAKECLSLGPRLWLYVFHKGRQGLGEFSVPGCSRCRWDSLPFGTHPLTWSNPPSLQGSSFDIHQYPIRQMKVSHQQAFSRYRQPDILTFSGWRRLETLKTTGLFGDFGSTSRMWASCAPHWQLWRGKRERLMWCCWWETWRVGHVGADSPLAGHCWLVIATGHSWCL